MTEQRPFPDHSADRGPYSGRNCRSGSECNGPNSETKYPTRRAYVVKVRSDATPDALIGRLENLVTGRRGEFMTAHELLRMIIGDIVESTSPDGL